MLIDSTADVTATVTGDACDFHGPDQDILCYRVYAPSATGTTPSMVAKIQESADKSTWTDLVAAAAMTAAGNKRLFAKSKLRYRRAVLTITGTTPNFGKVKVGLESGGQYTDNY